MIVYNTNCIDTGLIGNYDPGNPKSYPGSGSSITDLSNTMGTGTISTYTYSNGTLVNSSSSNSGGVSVSLTNFSKLVGSIEIWAKPSAWSDSNGLFVNRADATANAVDWLWFGGWGSGGTFYFRIGDGSTCCTYDNTFASPSTVHPVGSWGQYIVTWQSSGQSKIYFNTVLKNTVNLPAIPSTNPSSTGLIGLGHGSTNALWQGNIGITRIYNCALSQEEVITNFESTRRRYGL